MRVIFLGTGPAAAIPRPGHRDATCRDARQGGKSRRTRSAALIRDGHTTVLFDAGPDIREQLRRERVKTVAAVFLTHRHSDAAGGLRWLPREIPVYGPEANRPIRVGTMTVTPVPVRHAFDDRFPTRGFTVNGRLGYVSDCRAIPSASRRLLAGLDTLILDAAAYLGRHIPTHLSVEQAALLAARLDPQRLFLTQIGHSFPPHEIAERAVRRYAKAHGYVFPVRLAHDGLRVEIRNAR
ncbi:hypothetical protein A3C96_03780 [Candidatus Uhrbacteria bacterium RIFCSPHIGHO2_02_FULL_60_10]|uniref:Metallo-beta-lactamase domain-containing protein n=1 Tax=Candidatus Uhrbacteria bacterium RIFCSPHIGHO2_02_FULL_60_10 TaxID=1802392 RepID=A0A1F7U808_9BACT|nr:MAG: hypothetical protein A3C96_03780 [Candidatus Uhrbacteria bacterium RIFCSPHIGHO2_02_FULL_60_10]